MRVDRVTGGTAATRAHLKACRPRRRQAGVSCWNAQQPGGMLTSPCRSPTTCPRGKSQHPRPHPRYPIAFSATRATACRTRRWCMAMRFRQRAEVLAVRHRQPPARIVGSSTFGKGSVQTLLQWTTALGQAHHRSSTARGKSIRRRSRRTWSCITTRPSRCPAEYAEGAANTWRDEEGEPQQRR